MVIDPISLALFAGGTAANYFGQRQQRKQNSRLADSLRQAGAESPEELAARNRLRLEAESDITGSPSAQDRTLDEARFRLIEQAIRRNQQAEEADIGGRYARYGGFGQSGVQEAALAGARTRAGESLYSAALQRSLENRGQAEQRRTQGLNLLGNVADRDAQARRDRLGLESAVGELRRGGGNGLAEGGSALFALGGERLAQDRLRESLGATPRTPGINPAASSTAYNLATSRFPNASVNGQRGGTAERSFLNLQPRAPY